MLTSPEGVSPLPSPHSHTQSLTRSLRVGGCACLCMCVCVSVLQTISQTQTENNPTHMKRITTCRTAGVWVLGRGSVGEPGCNPTENPCGLCKSQCLVHVHMRTRARVRLCAAAAVSLPLNFPHRVFTRAHSLSSLPNRQNIGFVYTLHSHTRAHTHTLKLKAMHVHAHVPKLYCVGGVQWRAGKYLCGIF